MKALVELPRKEMIRILRELSPEEQRRLWQEVHREEKLEVKGVKMSIIVERFKGAMAIGGDALEDTERLYE